MIQKIKSSLNRNLFLESIRFIMVGFLSTAITYIVYFVLIKWLNVTIAFTISYFIAFIVNYILTTFFTFKVKATVKKMILFSLSNIINYLLSISLLNLFILLGLSKSIAPIPMFAITILSNFFIVRWVMRYR